MPSKNKRPLPVGVISDRPAEEKIHFGFDTYADTLAGLIANKDNSTPLVMGIYGPWGTGKTTLMRAIKSRLDSEQLYDSEYHRRCKTVWFSAWKYSQESEIYAALIEVIFKSMAADGFFGLAKSKVETVTQRINKSQIFRTVSNLLEGMDVSEFFTELEDKNKLGFYDTFQKFFDDLVWTYLNWRFKLTGQEKPDDKKSAMVLFIDDLDRCPRPHIVKVLETIKLFMNRSGTVFILGSDNEIIKKALVAKYSSEDATRFLEKIVQVSFQLPRIPPEDFTALLQSKDNNMVDLAHQLPMFMPALDQNPRRLKRFINSLNLLNGLLESSDIKLGFSKVLNWGIIEYAFSDLAVDIKDNPDNLFTLQNQIKRLKPTAGKKPLWQLNDKQLLDYNVPQSLHKYIQQRHLVEVVQKFDIGPKEFDCLRSLSATLELCQTPKSNNPIQISANNMVTIADGPFLFGVNKEASKIEQSYEIDIYLVTNAQYKIFIDENGYETQCFWSDQGWQWRVQKGIVKPALWEEPVWNGDNRPVVGVSWFEADAFARWAGKTLPTEEQWERAARGVDGWPYPWGENFDKKLCNTLDSGILKTSRTDRYPKGVSPHGCYDMAGNTWEWTSSVYDHDQLDKTYVIKGGAWHDQSENACCFVRGCGGMYDRTRSIGFRCARVNPNVA